METEFILHTDEVKCVLPCHGSSKCDCLRGWDVIQMSDINDVCDVKLNKTTFNTFGLYFRYKCMPFSNTAVNQSIRLSLLVILELL